MIDLDQATPDELKLALLEAEEQRVKMREEQDRQDAEYRTMAVSHAELARSHAELELRLKKAQTPEPTMGQARWILKVALHHNGQVYTPGTVVPFNPEDPPLGSGGLVEGEHYELGRG